MVRETPLTLVHLRNMVSATEAGRHRLPPVPSFLPAPAQRGRTWWTPASRVLDWIDIAPTGTWPAGPGCCRASWPPTRAELSDFAIFYAAIARP